MDHVLIPAASSGPKADDIISCCFSFLFSGRWRGESAKSQLFSASAPLWWRGLDDGSLAFTFCLLAMSIYKSNQLTELRLQLALSRSAGRGESGLSAFGTAHLNRDGLLCQVLRFQPHLWQVLISSIAIDCCQFVQNLFGTT